MARRETRGAELQDAVQQFGGDDRCGRVFMKRSKTTPDGHIAGSARLRHSLAIVRPLWKKDYDMAMLHKVVIVLALVLLLSLPATRPVDGEVPTAADFAACNEEAPQAVKAGTASPIMRDHVRADSARGGVPSTNSAHVSGKFLDPSDPQIYGMDAEGARNATYQAAYRSCMRRKGF